MIYNSSIATVPEHEFNELTSIVRDQAMPKPLSDDDRWRADYADEQRRRRIIGYQQDLFTSTAITHYRRSPAAPIAACRGLLPLVISRYSLRRSSRSRCW